MVDIDPAASLLEQCAVVVDALRGEWTDWVSGARTVTA